MQTVKTPMRTGPPPTVRSRWWLWGLVVLVVGAITTGLVWLLDEDDATIEPSATPAATAPVANTQPLVTNQPTPTQAPDPMASKTPLSSFEALIGATYASVEQRDTDGFYALRMPEAVHTVWYSISGRLTKAGTFTPQVRLELATDPLRSLKRLGPPLFSGMMAAVPAEFEYATETEVGFDLFRMEKVVGGYLIAEQATIYARTPVDPEVERFIAEDAAALLTDYIAAWNEGDTALAQAAFAPDGALWQGWNEPGRQVYEGADLAGFITANVWFDVSAPSEEALVAGPFLVIPNRLTSGDTSDGISLFMFEDGKIALQIFHQ